MTQFYFFEGVRYKSTDEAFNSFHAMIHGETPMQKERYHQDRLAFMCGIVAGVNLLSTLVADDPRRVNPAQKIGEHMQVMMADSMNKAMEEYQRLKE